VSDRRLLPDPYDCTSDGERPRDRTIARTVDGTILLLDIYRDQSPIIFQEEILNELVLLFLCWKEETIFVNANLEACLAS